MATAVPGSDNAVAPTGPPTVAVQNVHKLGADYGIVFGWPMPKRILGVLSLYFMIGNGLIVFYGRVPGMSLSLSIPAVELTLAGGGNLCLLNCSPR